MTDSFSARSHLRDATRSLHDEVEHAVDLGARVRDRAAYRSLVAALFGLHEPLEDRLGLLPWSDVGVDFALRRKSPLLRADLRVLGTDPDTVARCQLLPALDDLAAGLGCLYVLEGSTLGGQLIAREVDEALGLRPENGAAFFRSYGSDTGRMWRSFGRALDAFVTTPDRLGTAVSAAEATFEAFGSWVGRSEVALQTRLHSD